MWTSSVLNPSYTISTPSAKLFFAADGALPYVASSSGAAAPYPASRVHIGNEPRNERPDLGQRSSVLDDRHTVAHGRVILPQDDAAHGSTKVCLADRVVLVGAPLVLLQREGERCPQNVSSGTLCPVELVDPLYLAPNTAHNVVVTQVECLIQKIIDRTQGSSGNGIDTFRPFLRQETFNGIAKNSDDRCVPATATNTPKHLESGVPVETIARPDLARARSRQVGQIADQVGDLVHKLFVNAAEVVVLCARRILLISHGNYPFL
jgi:hypothetical protein